MEKAFKKYIYIYIYIYNFENMKNVRKGTQNVRIFYILCAIFHILHNRYYFLCFNFVIFLGQFSSFISLINMGEQYYCISK